MWNILKDSEIYKEIRLYIIFVIQIVALNKKKMSCVIEYI